MTLDFTGLKILVIGDPMVDCYRFGHVDRVSPEAPVPVFVTDRYDVRPGGASNVQAQLTKLGVETAAAWDADVMPSPTRKTRYMVGSHQLLRVDEDRNVPNTIPPLNGFHAIVISDYAKGACTEEICQEAIASGLPVIVDPKGKDWHKYRGCRLICPNTHEWDAHNEYKDARPDKLFFMSSDVLIKRGAEGLQFLSADGEQKFPANAQTVFDVTGCGDVVVAVVAACIAKGIDIPMACKLANIAAGYAASKVGTTVCPFEYLQEYAHRIL